MNRTQLKQLIRECIEETMQDDKLICEKMSRKDYILFAKGIKSLKQQYVNKMTITPLDFEDLCVSIFKADNPQFDELKFRQACGG